MAVCPWNLNNGRCIPHWVEGCLDCKADYGDIEYWASIAGFELGTASNRRGHGAQHGSNSASAMQTPITGGQGYPSPGPNAYSRRQAYSAPGPSTPRTLSAPYQPFTHFRPTPNPPVPVVDVQLSVADPLGHIRHLQDDDLRFLPRRWYWIPIRKGRQEDGAQWTQLAFPNVTAQDILDGYSDKLGRKMMRIEYDMNGREIEIQIAGQDLTKVVTQLITNTGRGLGLRLMVVDS